MQKITEFLNRHLIAVGVTFFILYVGFGVYLSHQAKPQHAEILKPAPTPPGPKRYVIWNKTALMRGDSRGRAMNVQSFASMGATNIQQLELINGATFEASPERLEAIQTIMREGDEWVVQPEIEHHILSGAAPVAAKCYQANGPLVEIACSAIPDPTPTPTPTPSPTPQPGPTPEPSKSWGRDRVHALEALARVDTSQVKIAIVDTGIDLQHPNNPVIYAQKDCTGKGTVQDGAGHGTHVAGTVAGKGGVGISRAKVGVYKGLSDNGSGNSSGLAQCLVAACSEPGVGAVSNSWGSSQPDGLINQAVQFCTQKGIYVFIAAGNDSGPVNWPAKLAGSNPLVFAIAASDQGDRIANFSSRGPEVRFISPGVSITSNWPGGATRALDGTSMGTPHAAAICAFGIARGRRPCVNTSGVVAGYPFADAAASAQ